MTDTVPTKDLRQKVQRIGLARYHLGCQLNILLQEGAITKEQYEEVLTITGARIQ
jgi:hypothetical protein